MKKIILITLLWCAVIDATAQDLDYTLTPETPFYLPITPGGGATQIIAGPGSGDFSSSGGVSNLDDGTAYLQLPFNFNYNGTTFLGGTDWFGVSTNGYGYFSNTNTNASKITTSDNTTLFTTSAPFNALAPWFDNLTLNPLNGFTPRFLFQTSGPVGDRILTMQWTDVPSYNSGTVQGLNFQIQLLENGSAFRFNYGSVSGGTVAGFNFSESASVGIKNAVGGNGNYIDGSTGHRNINHSMRDSEEFPNHRLGFNFGTPSPLPPGTYNIGFGQVYDNFFMALTDLHQRGVSGPVTFNLTDPLYDDTPAGGNNFFPILIGSFPGSSPVNIVTFNGLPGLSTINSRGSANGFVGNEDGPTVVHFLLEAIFALLGADNVNLRRLNINSIAPHNADRVIHLINSSGTNGARNNIIELNRLFGSRTNLNSIVIESGPIVPMTSPAGSNSFNIIRNNVLENAGNGGVWFFGDPGFPDEGNLFENNIVGADYLGLPPGDIGGNPTTNTFGGRFSFQYNPVIRGNVFRNITTGSTQPARGVFFENVTGIADLTYNKILGIRNSNTGSPGLAYGIDLSLGSSGTNSANIHNNFISDITSGYTGAPTAVRSIRGINTATVGNPSNRYDIDWNSIGVNGSGSPNTSSVGIEIGSTSSVNNLRNNSVSNNTAGQTGVAKHYAIRSPSSNSFGAVGSVSNYNNFFIANPTNGFVGLANTTDVPTVPNWTATMTSNPGSDVNSISADPLYISPTDLHIQSGSPNINAGIMNPPITTDIDNQTRPNGANPDIGADEFYSTLPVGLLYFTGEKKTNGNLLRWTTTNEQNNRGFELQKLSFNNQYRSIGFISSQAPGGNSNDLLNYEFLDANPAGLKQFYRLRQIDFDERSRFSNIVVIKTFSASALLFADIFPNPASDKLSVSFHSATKQAFTIVIVDVLGRKIKQQLVPADKGSNTTLININGIKNGYYLIQLTNATNDEMITGRFIKQ